MKSFIVKGQLISECLYDLLKFSKKNRKIWQISAPEHERCWNHQNKDNDLQFTYDYMGYLMYYSALILWFDYFLDSGAEICQIVVGFLEN